mgnify:CR=1 FL=1
MGVDKVIELRIKGLRTIEELTLPLGGLTLLIGENGAGKSSILEACEILRRASTPAFYSEVLEVHGGLFSLLRHGARHLELGVTVEGDGPAIRYGVVLTRDGISSESLELDTGSGLAQPFQLIRRTGDRASVASPGQTQPHAAVVRIQPDQLLLPKISGPLAGDGTFERMRAALEQIDVHLPFEVRPAWLCAERGWLAPLREPAKIQPAARLSRLGENLANAYQALKNEFGEEHWKTTMDYVRLGLGPQVESINARVDPGGNAIALWLKPRKRAEQLPASALSDGELSYLAFVALYRLPARRSLLAFDEPELHLHPSLLARVLSLLSAMAEDHPVLLATHSDRVLDLLKAPADAVRVCELDGEDRKTRLRKLDQSALEEWLPEYRGLGQLRTEGYLSAVLEPEEIA